LGSRAEALPFGLSSAYLSEGPPSEATLLDLRSLKYSLR
jgi:hypothetical protein